MNIFKKAKNSIVEYFHYTDKLLLILSILATAYGLVLVYSTVFSNSNSTVTNARGFYVQLGAGIVGLLAAVIISKIDYDTICSAWPFLAAIALILMILTFTPLGLNVAGTDDTAWLSIPLIGTFQPSELMKIVFIITFAKHLSHVREHINHPLTVLLLCLHGALPVLLVLKQGDDGTALVFMFIFASMLFAAGLKPVYFLVAAAGVVAAVPVVWNLLDDSKKGRFLCLFDVDKYLDSYGWQQSEGLKAIGSGQLWGVGFLDGGETTTVFARNNDFIFTVAGEEFGFIGSIVLIFLIVFIIMAIFRNAMRARDRLGMFLCVGVLSMIGFQSVINIGMNVRLLPVIGITLPFFSAGGSSLATLFLGVGVVLSVAYSSRARTRDGIFFKRE